jgi:hypothetical protein
LQQLKDITDPYCRDGHFGPLCEGCAIPDFYYDAAVGECVRCPARGRLFIAVLAVVIVAGLAAAANEASRRVPALRGRARRASVVLSQLSFQAKIKVIISFCQVASTLTTVYGVQLPEQFTGWLNFMDALNLDVLDLTLPSPCLGSMTTRLLFSATWPYALALMIIGIVMLHTAVHRTLIEPRAGQGDAPLFELLKQRALYTIILVFYLVLPTVSRSLFRARQCESLVHDDSARTFRSYLLADLRINCNDGGVEWGSEDFARLQPYF